MNSKKIHEKYHKKTKPQYKIICGKNFTYRILLSVINSYLKSEMKVLDIGCGAGTLDFYLANKGYQVTGVDISETAIRSCRETAKNLGIKNADFKVLDFPDETPEGKYDAVLFFEVIEHLADDNKALKRIYSLLKPGGILFLSTPSKNAPLYKLGLTKRFDKEVGHLRRYSDQGLSSMLKESGFKITELKKTEGILRNFLFVNPIAGKFIRFIKFFLSDLVTFIDNLTIPISGESNYIIVAKKVEANMIAAEKK